MAERAKALVKEWKKQLATASAVDRPRGSGGAGTSGRASSSAVHPQGTASVRTPSATHPQAVGGARTPSSANVPRARSPTCTSSMGGGQTSSEHRQSHRGDSEGRSSQASKDSRTFQLQPPERGPSSSPQQRVPPLRAALPQPRKRKGETSPLCIVFLSIRSPPCYFSKRGLKY